MARFATDFFSRPALEVAHDLLGCRLVRHDASGRRRVGRIVEVEAYRGDGGDPASHSHRGPTARNRAMFGPPGRFYIYRSMGIHLCTNVVCEPEGSGAAVLLRAVEPLEGIRSMGRARGGREGYELTNGPGKLSQAFGIDLDRYGRSVRRGPLRIEPALAPATGTILAGPRIGIKRGSELAYRLFIADSPWVTHSRLNRRSRPLQKV